MKQIVRIAGAVLGLTLGLGVVNVAPASAATPPETDQVYASVAGDTITGTVSWGSYRSGSATVTVHNQMTDNLCATAQQRVMRGGAWGSWTTIVILCTTASHTSSWVVRDTGQNVQYWQFRVRDANSAWAYDTNSPGGA